MSILVQLLTDTAKLPVKATEGSAAFDLFASRAGVIEPESSALVATDIAISLPPGTCGLVLPRSGLATKHLIDVPVEQIHPGLIDPDYRGELRVYVINRGKVAFGYLQGDRIAQLLVIPVISLPLYAVDALPPTTRLGGFGSTGMGELTPYEVIHD